MTVTRCIEEGLVSGQRMAVDASLIEADANKQNSTPKDEWDAALVDPADAPRAVREYLDTLDEAAFGAATPVKPKFTSHSDPASQWIAARKGPAFFSYSDNYLIDTDHGVIVDVEATRSIRQAEVGSTKTMLQRVMDKFDLHPECLIADTAYGSGQMLGWLVDRKIAPHIPVIDKAGRTDGTWTRADFEWDAENDQYICPEGHALKQFRRNYSDPRTHRQRHSAIPRLEGSLLGVPLEGQMLPERRRPPGCTRHCQDSPVRHLDEAPEEGRDALRSPQADPWPRKAAITWAMRCKRRIPPRRNRPKPPQTRQDLSCTAENANSLIGKAFATPFGRNFLRQQHVVFSTESAVLDWLCRLHGCALSGFPKGRSALGLGFQKGAAHPFAGKS